MATVRAKADDLQRQMAEVRSQLHQEVRGVVQGAKTAADWRSYVRSHPWTALAVAFASGYLLVPRRTSTPTVHVLPAAGIPQQSASSAPTAKTGSWPILGWVLSAVGPIALRAAQSYALASVESLLAKQPTGPAADDESRRDSPNQFVRPRG